MRLYTVVVLFLFSAKVFAELPLPPKAIEFVENKGQWDAKVLYNATLPQGWLFLEKDGFTYNFLDKNYFAIEDEPENKNIKFKGHAFKIHFVKANVAAKIAGQEKLAGYRNYFIGNEPANWASRVPAYKEIKYSQLYDKIDLRLYTFQGHLKYDYLVAPQAEISKIKMQYEGVEKLTLRNGRLHIITSVNEIIEEKPFAYQVVAGRQLEVSCEFILENKTVGFKITGSYNPDLPLVIDPEIIFMTYGGANSGLSANCATADAAGNTYFASRTMGPLYPVTPGAYQTVRQGNNTGISKLNENGTALMYATFLGGTGTSNDEYPLALVVNKQNELIILGHTTSAFFPTTPNAYDQTYNQNRDYFVSKLSATGSDLIASTYLGGSGAESGGIGNTPAQLALDLAGNIFVGGCTQSNDFRIVNGFQNTKNTGYDGIVIKMNSALTNLLWSSYLGGNSEDLIYDIKIGKTGKIYLGGSTNSSDFPKTTATLNQSSLGSRDGFVAIISAQGNQLETATYLGTAEVDLVKYIQIDKDDNVFATGFTNGAYTIAPADTYGTPNSNGGYFIHKLNPTLRSTIFSTHLGSNSGLFKVPTAFRVNSCGNIFLAGYSLTLSPLSSDAQERNRKTMYVCHLNKDAKKLIYASYLGGSDGQPHTHLANTSLITEAGMLHQIECTYARDQPVTPGAYDPTYFSSPDGAVVKYKFTPFTADQLKASANTPPPSCAPYNVQFTNTTENGTSYTWNFGEGNATSNQPNPVYTFQKAGTYRVRLIAANPASCKPLDTVFVNVTVSPPPIAALPRQARYLCNQSITLNAGNNGYNYLWSTGATTQTLEVSEPGTYQVEISLGTCKILDSVAVAAALPPIEVPNIITPNQDGKNDFFVIRNSGINTKLQVYNRWGNLVFKSDNYLNNWDGQHLTQGTYYYFIESESNCATKKGWLEIIY